MSNIEYGLYGLSISCGGIAVITASVAYHSASLAEFRQQLFSVRNRLWDQMRKLDTLDEPSHREVRNRINSIIRLAPVFNLVTICVVLLSLRKSPESETSDSVLPDNLEAAAAIRAASRELGALLARRVLLDTFPGLLIGWPILCVVKLRIGMRSCQRLIGKFLDHVISYFELLGSKMTIADTIRRSNKLAAQ